MYTKLLARPAIGTGLILLIPLVMTYLDRHKAAGDGWHWEPASFIVMGALLLAAGLFYEFIAMRLSRAPHRIAFAVAVAFVVAAIWSELAVNAVSQLIRHAFG